MKGIAWVVGGTVGIVVLAYLTLVAINWRDREPSAAAVRLANIYRDRPTVTAETNGFVFAMGLSVPPGDDPSQMGMKRVAWIEASTPGSPLNPAEDPLGRPPDRLPRAPSIRAFLDACRDADNRQCGVAFESGDEVLKLWVSSEGWLLHRYRELIARTGWRESVLGASAPLPSYAPIVDGQKLLLLTARSRARDDDFSAVRALLEEDLRFWRKVLESSDTLISKMIAARALTRHFELGNLVLRGLPAAHESDGVPAGWSAPISESERSMLRCMAGEWMYSSRIVRDMPVSDWVDPESSLFERATASIGKPFFQYQDTINVYADQYLGIGELLNVPLEEYEAAVNRVTRLAGSGARNFSAYNITGRVLFDIRASYGSYARRVADIEGVRRVAMAAVALREARTPANEVGAALTTSPWRNPYNGRAFDSDQDGELIVFRGLEAGERGEHRITY